jgi:hypothetical protein
MSNIGNEFIDFYYNNIHNNPNIILNNIESYSKFIYNKTIYYGNDIIILLKSFNNYILTNINFEILDSKSRQIYVLVNGNINNKLFTQSFLLSYNKKWIIINSLLIII